MATNAALLHDHARLGGRRAGQKKAHHRPVDRRDVRIRRDGADPSAWPTTSSTEASAPRTLTMAIPTLASSSFAPTTGLAAVMASGRPPKRLIRGRASMMVHAVRS
jgi:hypothetical protein